MKLRFKVADRLWVIVEDVVIVQVFSSDRSTREFFEAVRLTICRSSSVQKSTKQ